MKFSRPKIRRFGFKTYYYDPEQEEQDPKRRLQFKRINKSKKPQAKPARRYILFLILVAYFVWYLGKMGNDKVIRVEELQIEDISQESGN